MDGEATNCVIFVSDALRWDHLPEEVADGGVALKSVAASVNTATSFPSMISGLNPINTGVNSFEQRIPSELDTLFDFEGYDVGFQNAAGPDDGLNSVLRRDEMTELSKLEPPFIYLERDHGGHHPYRGAGYERSLAEFRREFAGDTERVQEMYDRAVTASEQRFRDRLATLSERGLLEDTLVVFTSDHGELLGEHGHVGHLAPVHPQLVYVPTVFHHPGLPEDVDRPFMGHVDLLPTVRSYLGVDTPSVADGVDVFGSEPMTPRVNYALESLYVRGRRVEKYEATSLWDGDGGHVFSSTGLPKWLVSVAYLLAGSKWPSRHVRRNLSKFPSAARGYLASLSEFGTPGFDSEQAREQIAAADREEVGAVETVKLDDTVEENLRQLGYR